MRIIPVIITTAVLGWLSSSLAVAETTKPSLTISSPVANAQLTSVPITFSGNATDNVSVTRVQFSTNNGTTWGNATLGTGTTSRTWTANVTVAAGSASVLFRAVDSSANVGANVARQVAYTSRVLSNNATASALSGVVGSERLFKITVPAGQAKLGIKIEGGTGDANLYVKRGAIPTTTTYDYRPNLSGNAETVTVLHPVAGGWYIMVRGVADYAGLSLVADYSTTFGVVRAPVIRPGSMTSQVPVSVTIGCASNGATIRYTTNGTTPTATSTVYRGAFLAGSSSTVKAQAFSTGYTPSPVASATYTIDATVLTILKNNVTVGVLSGALGSERVFKIAIPAGQAKLMIRASGGSGDANLYIKYGAVPTVTNYDYRPYLAGNAETVAVTNPVAGDWYIMVRGAAAYAELSLVANYTAPQLTAMELIPAGSFQMGNSLSAVGDGGAEELPVHMVTVSEFYMEKYETTKELWDSVRALGSTQGYTDLAAGNGSFASKGVNHPVHSISWFDMVKWCNARSEAEGLTPCYTVNGAIYKTGQEAGVVCNFGANGYRLPTEAEWEKAARGGLIGKRYPWGDTISHSQANYYSSSFYSYDVSPTRGFHPIYKTGSMPYTAPVNSFGANGYGLYNMVGNVLEWCWDRYQSSYYSDPSAGINPQGPASGLYRVVRGGSWDIGTLICRVANRNSGTSSVYSHTNIGFRCARSSVP